MDKKPATSAPYPSETTPAPNPGPAPGPNPDPTKDIVALLLNVLRNVDREVKTALELDGRAKAAVVRFQAISADLATLADGFNALTGGSSARRAPKT